MTEGCWTQLHNLRVARVCSFLFFLFQKAYWSLFWPIVISYYLISKTILIVNFLTPVIDHQLAMIQSFWERKTERRGKLKEKSCVCYSYFLFEKKMKEQSREESFVSQMIKRLKTSNRLTDWLCLCMCCGNWRRLLQTCCKLATFLLHC